MAAVRDNGPTRMVSVSCCMFVGVVFWGARAGTPNSLRLLWVQASLGPRAVPPPQRAVVRLRGGWPPCVRRKARAP
eukprot:3206002-Lingulodinium_polyedra.AAC.1